MSNRTYIKLDTGTYEVTTEQGNYNVKRSLVGISMVLSNVRRSSSRANDWEKLEEGFSTKRSIEAAWAPENYYFELINEQGEKRVNLPVSVYIGVGDPARSALSHWTAAGEFEEQFNISVYVPQDTFDWLWNEIERRPTANVAVHMHVIILLAGIESSMYYEVHHNPIRLEPEERVAIQDIGLSVGDPEPQVRADRPEPEGTYLARLEQSYERVSTDIWLKRIFFALVILTVILLFKR